MPLVRLASWSLGSAVLDGIASVAVAAILRGSLRNVKWYGVAGSIAGPVIPSLFAAASALRR
jgi:hypothetical protein